MHFLSGIYGMSASERKAKIKPLLEFVDMIEAQAPDTQTVRRDAAPPDASGRFAARA